MRNRITVVAVLVSSLLWSSTAFAQQRHVVDPSAIRQTVAAHVSTDQQNRDVVLALLRQTQVRAIANDLGLSLTRAEGALSTMTSAELAEIATTARAASAELTGGNRTLVISTTTLLLIIIIVILIAN